MNSRHSKPNETPTIDRSLIGIAALHRGAWNLLLVRSDNGTTRVLSATTHASITDAARALQDASGADLRILHPTSATIVKIVSLPMIAASQMAQALKLQAEGMLLGATPACRVGLAPIPAITSGADRQGLILVWPESSIGIVDKDIPNDAQFIPEPAALLPFLTSSAPTFIADRATGTVLLGLQGETGLILRSTREDASDDAAWRAGVRRSLVESLMNGGRSPVDAVTEADRVLSCALSTEDGLREIPWEMIKSASAPLRFEEGIPVEDRTWWSTWALLVGAAIASQGEYAGLTQLRREVEHDAPTLTDRFIQRFSSRRRAVKLVLAVALLLGLAPMLFGWMRVAILQWKLPSELGAFERQQRAVDRRVAIYRELSEEGMPVAKMLGDLACCTIDGIELISIHLSKNQGLVIRGTARTQSDAAGSDLVARMVSQLRDSKIFDAVTVSFAPPDARGIYVFTLNADIEAPTTTARIPEERDWSVKSFSERKWGKLGDEESTEPVTSSAAAPPTAVASAAGATTTPTSPSTAPGEVVAAPPAAPDSASPATPSRGIGRRTEIPPGETDGTAAAGPATTAVAIQLPAEFTDEELRGMSKEQARGLIGEIAQARKQPGLEPEVLTRLNKDWKRLLDFLKSAS